MATDITKEGMQSWRDLQNENEEPYTIVNNDGPFKITQTIHPKEENRYPVLTTTELFGAGNNFEHTVPIGEMLGNIGYGNSRYDQHAATPGQLEDLQDVRALSEPAIAKWGAGLAKCAGLAMTTFADGTIGLLAGIGTSIADKRISGLWDNEVSNALQDFNKKMEEWLPNYRTQYEQERPWWKNLGTANFWADGLIKNLGFTIGAYYSGAAWLGALKGVKAATMALKARGIASATGKSLDVTRRYLGMAAAKTNGVGASLLGSFLSGFNEGRIEANNNSDEFLELENHRIKDAYDKRREELEVMPDSYIKQRELAELDMTYKAALEDAKNRADAMGLADLIGNSILLTATNYWEFGKLYSRGFNNAKGLRARIAAGMRAENAVGDQIARQGTKYFAKEVSGVAKGVSNAFAEGFEEMNQKWIATSSGMKRSGDSPDAYYSAIVNPEKREEFMHTANSVAKGFVDTYGNLDNWQEFALGFMTGALGMPTVGRLNNSAATTYVGRGKAVGISGGILGEVFNARETNRRATAAAETMNKMMEKLAKQGDYFVMNYTFADEMDGYAAADNKFEYKNSEDSDDFASAAAFADAGRMDDLMEIVNQDYEHMSQEELESIAMNTTPNIGLNDDNTVKTKDGNGNILLAGWRNEDGTLMTSTPEGTERMRQELIKKRDKIIKGINDYVQTVSEVRARANGSLNDSEIEELAWLSWKTKQWRNRYNSISSENAEFRQTMQDALHNTITQIKRVQQIDKELETAEGQAKKDLQKEKDTIMSNGINPLIAKMSEDGEFLDNLQVLSDYFDAIQNMKSADQMGLFVDANKKIIDIMQNDAFLKVIMSGISGIDSDTYTKGMKDLADLAKIGTSIRSFTERYEEFITNPLKQRRNRARIEDEEKEKERVRTDLNDFDRINQMSEKELAQAIIDGTINPDEAIAKAKENGQDKIVEKLERAKEFKDKVDQIHKNIDEAELEPQVKADAHNLVDNAFNLAENIEDLMDLNFEGYIDDRALDGGIDVEGEQITDESANEIEEDLRRERMDAARGALSSIFAHEEEIEEALKDDLPDGLGDSIEEALNEDAEEVGHDKTTKTTPVNDSSKSKEKFEEEKEEKVKEAAINKVNEVAQERQFDKIFPSTQVKNLKNDLYTLFKYIAKNYEHLKESNFMQALKNSELYKKLALYVKNIDDYINSWIEYLKGNIQNMEAKEEQDVEVPLRTTNTTEEALDEGKTEQEFSKEDLPDTTGGQMHAYWRTNNPMYVWNKTTKQYELWQPQTKRDIAVANYYAKNNIYAQRDAGIVQQGDTIYFTTNSELNEEAGETVILMAIKNGKDLKVVGEIGSIKNTHNKDYIGLEDFIARFENDYKEFSSKEQNQGKQFVSKETTKVLSYLSGYILYTDKNTRLSLNEIFGKDNIEFVVAKNDGQRPELLGPKANVTMRPLDPKTKAGQPFVLIRTNNKKIKLYRTVPFSMPFISRSLHSKTKLYQEIESVVQQIAKGNNSPTRLGQLKLALLRDVNVDNIWFETDSSNNLVKVKISKNDLNKEISLAGKTPEQIFTTIMDTLEGFPYAVDADRFSSQEYTHMIGELAETNLPKGFTHTVGNWFVVNPVGANGKMLTGKAPENTNVPKDVKDRVTKDIKPDDRKKPDTTEKLLDENEENEIEEGIEGLSEDKKTLSVEEWKEENSDLIIDEVWNNLNDEQKELLTNVSRTELKGVMQQLDNAMFIEDSDEEEITNIIKENIKNEPEDDAVVTLRRVNTRDTETANIKKELEEIRKCLPQLSDKEVVRIHDGLIRVNNSSNPIYAWGKFKDGIIILSNQAATGTVYHESFHYVFNTLLTNDEIMSALNAAEEIYGKDKTYLELEEALAEDFRRYMQFQEKLSKAEKEGNKAEWERIKSEIKSLLDKLKGKDQILNTLFANIYNRKYADRQSNPRSAVKLATEREMQSIKERAIANGTFMQAPNGKSTNLTERQWLQVRTKNFINWFGDWINDPANASKVIDENGEPLVVYHGSPSEFTQFDKNVLGSNTGANSAKLGFFFSKTYEASRSYIGDVGIGEDNLGYYTVIPELEQLQNEIYSELNILDNEYQYNMISKEEYDSSKAKLQQTLKDETNKIYEKIRSNNKKVKGNFLNIRNLASYTDADSNNITQKITDAISKKADGAVLFGVKDPTTTDDYVVFAPNQIKSATDNIGTFSEDDDTRYREITEEEYVKLVKEYQLSREKADSFISNFMTRLINVNPKSKINSSRDNFAYSILSGENLGKFVGPDDYLKKMKKFVGEVFGIDTKTTTVGINFVHDTREEFAKNIDNFLDKWEDILIDEINKQPVEINKAYNAKRDIDESIKLLTRYLHHTNLNEGFTEDEKQKIKDLLIINKPTKRDVGYKIQQLKRQLPAAEERIRMAYYKRAARLTAARNRIVAMHTIDNLKDLIKERLLREYDSYRGKPEDYKKVTAHQRELYDKIKKAQYGSHNSIAAFPDDKIKTITYQEFRTSLVQDFYDEYIDLIDMFHKANPELKITVGEGVKFINGIPSVGSFNSATNTLWISNKGDIFTVVHEMAHAATLYGIGNTVFKVKHNLDKSIEKFMDYIKDYIAKNKLLDTKTFYNVNEYGLFSIPKIYGFTNTAEFLAEVFADEEFQNFLDTIPAMNTKQFNSLLQEIWSTIVDFINKILGNTESKTALDQAKKLGYAAMCMQKENIEEAYKKVEELKKNSRYTFSDIDSNTNPLIYRSISEVADYKNQIDYYEEKQQKVIDDFNKAIEEEASVIRKKYRDYINSVPHRIVEYEGKRWYRIADSAVTTDEFSPSSHSAEDMTHYNTKRFGGTAAIINGRWWQLIPIHNKEGFEELAFQALSEENRLPTEDYTYYIDELKTQEEEAMRQLTREFENAIKYKHEEDWKFDNMSIEDRDTLSELGYTKNTWDALTLQEKEQEIRCVLG